MSESAPFRMLALLSLLAVPACQGPPPDASANANPEPWSGAPAGQAGVPVFRDVSATHLPEGVLDGLSMDAGVADIDADGDLDIVIANEFRPNILLLNDGSGRFTEATLQLFGEGITGTGLDLEFGDFNGDGLEDMFLASRGTPDRLLLKTR